MAQDSTPMIFELEQRHAEREHRAGRIRRQFLACLLEDMADEWATKLMFHYRWFYADDQEALSRWLAYDSPSRRRDGEITGVRGLQFRGAADGADGAGRVHAGECAVIEETMRRLCGMLEEQCTVSQFWFGSQPSLAEFAGWDSSRSLRWTRRRNG